MTTKPKLHPVEKALLAAIASTKKRLTRIEFELKNPPAIALSRLNAERLKLDLRAGAGIKERLERLVVIDAQIEVLKKKAKRYSVGKLYVAERALRNDIAALEDWLRTFRFSHYPPDDQED